MRRVDPRHLFLAMVGACSFPMAERALFAELMGGEPTRAQLDAYANFVVDLFLVGLADDAGKREREGVAGGRTFLTILLAKNYRC